MKQKSSSKFMLNRGYSIGLDIIAFISLVAVAYSFTTSIFAVAFVALPILISFILKIFMKEQHAMFSWLITGLTVTAAVALISNTYGLVDSADRIIYIFIFLIFSTAVFHISYSSRHTPKKLSSKLLDVSYITVPFIAAISLSYNFLSAQSHIIEYSYSLASVIYAAVCAMVFFIIPDKESRSAMSRANKYFDEGISIKAKAKAVKLSPPGASSTTVKPYKNPYGRSFIKDLTYRRKHIRIYVTAAGLEKEMAANPAILKAFNPHLYPQGQLGVVANILSTLAKPFMKPVALIIISSPSSLKKTVKVTIGETQYYVIPEARLDKETSDIIENL